MSMDDQQAVYDALLTAQQAGDAVVLATIVRTSGSMPRHAGSKMLVYADGTTVGTVGGGAMEAGVIEVALESLADGESRLESYTLNSLEEGDLGICGGTADIFIEAIGLTPILLVIGGGHTGKALAELGKWAGFKVWLSDDREAYCNPQYLPNLDGYFVCAPNDLLTEITITKQTYVAAVTRGLPIDLDLIPKLLETDAPYIGLIGSRRRWAVTRQGLMDKGLSHEELMRIRAPIGLELEAETPKEIAVSILAEIIMLRRGGTGQPMQWRGDDNVNR